MPARPRAGRGRICAFGAETATDPTSAPLTSRTAAAAHVAPSWNSPNSQAIPRLATLSSWSKSSAWLVMVPGPIARHRLGIEMQQTLLVVHVGQQDLAERGRVGSLVVAELQRRQSRTVGGVGGEHHDDLRATVHGEVGRNAQLLVETGHLRAHLARDPDLLVQRDAERMQLVAELEPLLLLMWTR